VVRREGQIIELSAKEYAMLEYLIRNAGRVVSKAQMIEHVWNYDADVTANSVEVYIGYLRNKIDKPFNNLPNLIHTKRGFGYILDVKND
jgi:DNA-binding response OmpR family regulator